MNVASVVGIASDTRWGQVLTTPHAYGVVEVYSPDGIARVLGIQILTKLTRLFLTPPVSLSKLSAIADALMSEDVVSILLLVPVGPTLYLVQRGGGAIMLKRDTRLATLLEGPGNLSGDLRPSDTVIVASRGFVAALPPREIMASFDHLTPPEVAEKLTLKLHEHDNGGSGATALILAIDPEPKKETPYVVKTNPLRTFGQRIPMSRRHLLVYVVMALFSVSVVLGIKKEMSERGKSTIMGTIRQARFSFDEGMALLELNPVKGRERLTQARDALSPVVAKKRASREAKEAKALFDEIVSSLTRAMRITNVAPELYFDMGLLKSGAIATDISLFENTIGIIDAQGFTAFTLGISPKAGLIVGGGGALTGMSQVAAYGDKLYVWTPSGIHHIRLTDQKTVTGTIPPSAEWGTITDFTAFGGNLYLLDTQKSRIWKYVATEKGFSQLFEYLNPDTLPDLTHATNMAIDGSVWFGTTTGTILRFTAGKENSFTMQGIDTPLGHTLLVYTDADVKMVYVLDRDNNRVVVFDKDGLYMAQYIWGKDFSSTNFVVSEQAGKIFLLRDGKIYTVDLK